MATVHISVPDELKAQMDIIEIVSWSAVARLAFEAEVRHQQARFIGVQAQEPPTKKPAPKAR